MKSASVAVLALIGQASAIKSQKVEYQASADDFEEPAQFYNNMVQAKTLANMNEFDAPASMAQPQSEVDIEKKKDGITEEDDYKARVKKIQKNIDAKESIENQVKKAIDLNEKAHQSPDGLYTEGGKKHFADGGVVRGANAGIFAQAKGRDFSDLVDEIKGNMKKEADAKAEVEKKQKAKEEADNRQKEADARWEKADRFTGTVHEKDGSRTFAPEGTKVGGVNNHVQLEKKLNLKQIENEMKRDIQETEKFRKTFKLNQKKSSHKAHSKLRDDGDDDENDDSSLSEKEEKKKMLNEAKAQSAINQKKIAEDEAAAKKDADDTVKETYLNRYTGTYHNPDGTRQFKDADKKGAAGAYVGGVNNYLNTKKKMMAYSEDDEAPKPA